MNTLQKTASLLAVSAVFTLISIAGLARAATSVNLGDADSFAVLAGSFITASTPSVVSGDVGLSPAVGTFYTSLTTGMVTGTIYAVDATGPAGASGDNPTLLTNAQNSLTTAYTNAAGQAPDTIVIASSIDSFSGTGYTLTPGVYNSGSTMGITGTLTLDGGGDPNAIFVFQAGSSLTTASGASVVLINSAQACNVFWQVGSSATLGTGTLFKGNILAFSSITDNGGSTVEGRLLARNAAVTLNNTIVSKATCVGAPPAPTTGSTGARYFPQLPAINITKIPTPLSLPTGPGAVTYAYAVTNIGKVPMNTVWVKDDKCSSVQFVSGDTNGDAMLDLTEVWSYTCSKTVSQTETNTATAHGWGIGLGMDVYDTASATVVVGLPITPPLIHLVKTATPTVLPAGGGPVVYSYLVTNPGIVPLNNVSIADDKCTGLPGRIIGHPGDLNQNNLLENNEVWQFTCSSNIAQTTTNIGTAEGHANGLTAIDFSPATVVVSPPGLPNTGLPPREASPWSTVLSAGALMLAAALAVILSRRAD